MIIAHLAPHEKICERVSRIFVVTRAEELIERRLVGASQFLQINNNQLPKTKVQPSETRWRRPILNRAGSNGNMRRLFPS